MLTGFQNQLWKMKLLMCSIILVQVHLLINLLLNHSKLFFYFFKSHLGLLSAVSLNILEDILNMAISIFFILELWIMFELFQVKCLEIITGATWRVTTAAVVALLKGNK